MRVQLLAVIIVSIMMILFNSASRANDAKIIEREYKWFNITGSWDIVRDKSKSVLTESRIRVNTWNYSELVNNNSIVTFNSLSKYTKIAFNFELQTQLKKSTSFMIIFSMIDQNQFYAFKFSGNEYKLNKVSFINSKYKNPEKGGQIKGNFLISEYGLNEIDLDYGKRYKVLLKIDGYKVSLNVDNKSLLDVTSTDRIDKGKIGFAINQVKPFIDAVTVYDGRKIVFEDRFSTDLIKKISVTGTLERKNK
jgi:hypothetical protein